VFSFEPFVFKRSPNEALELGRAYADEAQALFRKSANDLGAVVKKEA